VSGIDAVEHEPAQSMTPAPPVTKTAELDPDRAATLDFSLETGLAEAVEGEGQRGIAVQPKLRGRKPMFSAEQLAQANQMKRDGKPNVLIAKCLYGVQSPTDGQRRSVLTILKYHSEKQGRKIGSKK